MRLDLFWMIGELKRDKVGMTELAAVGAIREAELQVIEDVGGIRNQNLSRLYRQTVVESVNLQDNAISLPDGSANVIRVSVDDQVYTTLRTEDESVHGKSILHMHSAIIDGGQIRLLGLPKGQSVATVIVQRPMSSTIYVEGLRVFKSVLVFPRKGVPNPTFVLEYPQYQQFTKDSLVGGTLRIARTGSMAQDYEIAKNEFVGREIVYGIEPAQSAPISWHKFTTAKAIEISESEYAMYPDLEGIRVDADDANTYPAAIARTNMPDTLRPLVLTLAKWKATNVAQFHAEYQGQIERWRLNNAS